MSDLLERSLGAVTFTQRLPTLSGASAATLFSNQPLDDCIDQAWDQSVGTLRTFRELQDDWDGNDAVPPAHDLIEMAIGLAARLKDISQPAPHRVVAGVNGTISFEFAGDVFTEIEIVSATEAEVYEDGQKVGAFHAAQ